MLHACRSEPDTHQTQAQGKHLEGKESRKARESAWDCDSIQKSPTISRPVREWQSFVSVWCRLRAPCPNEGTHIVMASEQNYLVTNWEQVIVAECHLDKAGASVRNCQSPLLATSSRDTQKTRRTRGTYTQQVDPRTIVEFEAQPRNSLLLV